MAYRSPPKGKVTCCVEVGERSLIVEGTCSVVVDNNYGADADGNRGVSMTFYEDFEIESIDDNETGESFRLEVFTKEEQEQIWKAFEDGTVDPPYEPDYDDWDDGDFERDEAY